jgi:hypothetical protein
MCCCRRRRPHLSRRTASSNRYRTQRQNEGAAIVAGAQARRERSASRVTGCVEPDVRAPAATRPSCRYGALSTRPEDWRGHVPDSRARPRVEVGSDQVVGRQSRGPAGSVSRNECSLAYRATIRALSQSGMCATLVFLIAVTT